VVLGQKEGSRNEMWTDKRSSYAHVKRVALLQYGTFLQPRTNSLFDSHIKISKWNQSSLKIDQ
jgi:hypothetical protein